MGLVRKCIHDFTVNVYGKKSFWAMFIMDVVLTVHAMATSSLRIRLTQN